MSDFQKIDEDDYFRLNDIFCIWLMKKQNTHFEDLSYKDAKKKFKKFCKRYNNQKLDPLYYEHDKLIEKYQSDIQSKHKWNFK
ncbi:unnamed protein product [Paramecium primaurelia]|uniref:Uncharacterized protein n=1 Tax=Paramecium primaurelia TaxID=5886 RepID=A0A8S1PYN9_PARPR|nr:unnamed protein product [Paramecium primaurelia]